MGAFPYLLGKAASSRSMTFVHLRWRVHHHRKPERRETIRWEHHDLRDRLDSKNLQRQSPPGGIAGPAHVSGDRRLQVGVGHNTAKPTKSFGAESFVHP